jgi:amidase
LSVIQSRTSDGRDPATAGVPLGWTGRTRPTNIPADYTRFLDRNGLRGARLGLTRSGIENAPAQVGAAFDEVLAAIEAAGATVIDLDAAGFVFPPPDGEFLVLVYEFRDDLRNYLATRRGVPLAGGTIVEAIAFNEANAAKEMPFFAQEIFELTNSLELGADMPQPVFGGMTYHEALDIDRLAGVNGIDKALEDFDLDAIIAPTDNPAWATDLLYGDRFLFGSSGLAAGAGYPIIQVPATNVHGAPLGISFFGTAFSEPALIKLASGFEAATRERAKNPPTFVERLPDDHVEGVPVSKSRASSSKQQKAPPQDAKPWRPRRM